MKMKIKLVKLLFGVLLFIFLVSFSAKRHACKPVSDIQITIDHSSKNRFVNDELIRKILDGKALKVSSMPLGNLDIFKIEKTLNQNPFIKEAQVYKDVDGKLQVKIKQKMPIMRVNTGNEEYYLSDELTKIPLSNLYSAEVILAGGAIEKSDFEGLKMLLDFVSADKLLKKHIIAVKKEGPNSFILLVNKGDYIIEFGELNNFDEKFEKLKLFYDQYLSKVGMDYYSKINLKFNNQIVATKRKNDEN